MRKLAAVAALALTAVLATSCRPVTACPAIAQAPVVSLTVDRAYAPSVKAVHLRACQDGRCKEADLELMPGSTAVDQGCEPGPSGGDGVCSATSSPDGTLTGMLMMEPLTASRIDVTATVTDAAGHRLPPRTAAFKPRVAHPFGEQCGSFITAGVVLDAGGLRQAP
ncbi:hypothetical protein [Arthrobacter sp. NicSoilB8]|uniref:hypothetical protein n=1 Tax=Arthrobacter sp. NicSoilB8 TaxID=2830998 RepID=UPI001CC3FDE3|nr:hypothetical protein [Arthrobacter sp. NicSoilB8]BCW69241.1 hypothetical protein NicSoilB8_02850 [Arthrobacter sp. NicSoilB8]